MKYLCLIYTDEPILDTLPTAEAEQLMAECKAFGDDLQRRGHLLAAEKLAPVSNATTLRSRGGKLTVTDGPFAETREQLGGFYLIEARDLNEAIQLAGNIPPVRYGSVEVRPVSELPGEPQS